MIAARAGLKKVPWDGYLKHNRPSPKHTEEKWVSSLTLSPISHVVFQIKFLKWFPISRQRIFAESVLRRLEEKWRDGKQ